MTMKITNSTVFTAETFQTELLNLIENSAPVGQHNGRKNFIRVIKSSMSLTVKIEAVENVTDSVYETFLLIDNENTKENIFAMHLDKAIFEPAEIPFTFYLNPAVFAEMYFRIKSIMYHATIQTISYCPRARRNTLANYFDRRDNSRLAVRPRHMK